MGNMRHVSKIAGFILCLALVISLLPLYNAKAAQGSAVINFGAPTIENSVLKFPEATVTSNFGVYSITVSVSDGSIINTDFSNADVLAQHKTATWLYEDDTPQNAAAVQTFIRGLRFNYVSGMTVTVNLDGNSGTNVPEGATISSLLHNDGTKHYYMFVPCMSEDDDPEQQQGQITWDEAYDLAKTYTYKGMKGYLATITQVEEDIVIDSLTTLYAWAGGARVDSYLNSFDYDNSYHYGNITAVIDEEEIDNYSYDYCVSYNGELYQYTGNDDEEYYEYWCDMLQMPTKWVWTCGPEAGTLIRLNKGSELYWYDYIGKITDDSTYSNWNSDEPNGFSNEWCMQVHRGTQSEHISEGAIYGWNDLPDSDMLPGFIVEFSKYTGTNGGGVVASAPTSGKSITVSDASYEAEDEIGVENNNSGGNSGGGNDEPGNNTGNNDPVPVTEPTEHQHVWDVKVADKKMTVKCIAEVEPKCVCCNEEYIVELEVKEGPSSDNEYVSLKETGSAEAKELLPEFKLTFEGTDNTTYSSSETAPSDPGTYKATLEFEGRIIEATFDVSHPSGDTFAVVETYCYRYPGTGVNRANGFIDYTPRADVLNFAYDGITNQQVGGTYINMTKETLVTDFKYDCYTVDGGKKWVKGKLDDKALAKAFGKTSNIRLSDKYDAKSKKPGEGAVQLYFNTINKRPDATSLKVNYQLYMDPYGITNGQWTLMKVTTEVNLYQYYEIGTGDGKTVGKQGFGTWPSLGGVWVPELTSAGKTQKVTYFYRTRATVDTPASKTKKIKISSVLAPTKLKADYKKEILKMKKGVSLYFGETIPNLTEIPYNFEANEFLGTETAYEDFNGKYLKTATAEQAKGISIEKYLTETRNTINAWINASATKPATAVQQIVLAARGVISAEKKLKCEKGTVVLEKSKDISYEFYDETAQKWVSKVPAVSENTKLRCRIKCNVKGGKENGKNYASGIEAECEVTVGIIDEKSEKTGIVSATIKPKG